MPRCETYEEGSKAIERARPFPTSDSWQLETLAHKLPMDGAKQRTAAFGAWTDVSLATARMRAAELTDKIATGNDSAAKEGAPAAPVKPFKDAARKSFNAREAQWVSGYAARIGARLAADTFPKMRAKDVATITTAEVLALLRAVKNRNAIELPKRLRQTGALGHRTPCR